MSNKMEEISQRDKELTDAQWKLVADHISLVDVMYNLFKNRYKIASNDPDEYKDAGTWGLIHAARKFNSLKNVKFSTYALKVIFRDMIRCYKQNQKRNELFKSRDSYHQYMDDQGINIDEEIDKKTKDSILDTLVEKEKEDLLKNIISEAPRNYSQILKMRFGENKTFQSIGDSLGVTREMARIYCKRAINYVRYKIKSIIE